MLHAGGTALDALDVAMCVFDAHDRTLIFDDVELRVRVLIAGLMARIAAGELTMPVERSFPLAEAAAAHAFAERARPLGRVLLDMNGTA